MLLQYTMNNKFAHTQKPEDTCGDNLHADHHLLHVKNYGIYNCLLDMYCDTSSQPDSYKIMPTLYCPGGANLVFTVQRSVKQDQCVFILTPVVN